MTSETCPFCRRHTPPQVSRDELGVVYHCRECYRAWVPPTNQRSNADLAGQTLTSRQPLR